MYPAQRQATGSFTILIPAPKCFESGGGWEIYRAHSFIMDESSKWHCAKTVRPHASSSRAHTVHSTMRDAGHTHSSSQRIRHEYEMILVHIHSNEMYGNRK